MPNSTEKGLKPIIIKYMAMLMGIFYLIGPLQQPISGLLHEISHSIESPTGLISHESISNSEHRSLDHYDSFSKDMHHEHDLVDFIIGVFENSENEKNSEESLLKKVKIDKHITANQFQLQRHYKSNTLSTFKKLYEKYRCGYFEKIKRPPQCILG